MDVQFGPNSVDEPNILYKLQRKLKVFQTNEPMPNRGYNLVTSSSKYALVFVAVPSGTLSVYQLNQLVDTECSPQHISVKLEEKPSYVAVSCDQELLLVTGGQILSFFKVTDFQNQNVSPSLTIRTDVNPSTYVSSLQWNPCIPESLAIAFFDGTLLACHVNTGQIKKVPSKVRCICWSPKGKQLVTGNDDGTLCQYKPDLTPAKTVPAPKLFEGAPISVLAIHWISTYQFAVVYKTTTDYSRPSVSIINTPKTGAPTCVNYEDICYSMGSNRPSYYYLQGLMTWNIILASSSNSMELATLGSKDGSNWVQWCQPDEARPDLPLTDKKQESFPVGISIDTCGIHQLPWGENEILPHMPLLHIVSQTGLLTTFNIVNLNKDAPPICCSPQVISLHSASLISEIPDDTKTQSDQTPAVTVQPKIEEIQPSQQVAQQLIPQSYPPQSQFTALQQILPSNTLTQAPINQVFTPATVPQLPEQKDVQRIPQVQPQIQPQVSVTAQSSVLEPQMTSQIPENSALKAEQERMQKLKANQELKNMLVKEVNDFQIELYKFMVESRKTQARLQHDIDSINENFRPNTLDAEQLKKDCSLDELKRDIVQLKLELVRVCAVVAEARAHSETKELHQWTKADPLTTKRVASVKKLAYYVETQLDQVQKALDYKWKELESRNPNLKPGERMIRPILDDVYQPLVKQQEILSRQQAMLRTLRSTLNECDVTPMFKSTSLLRKTPFRNKDPLSTLTKNILNMSIETQTKTKERQLTAQKLDALRDILSNHKTIKIKPMNVELRQPLASIKLNYEKCMKERAERSDVQQIPRGTEPKVSIKVEPHIKPAPMSPINVMKTETKPEQMTPQPLSIHSSTPVNNMKPFVSGIANVAKKLFTDEQKQESYKPIQQQQQIHMQPKKPVLAMGTSYSSDTGSVIKDLLQNKTQTVVDPKPESSIFKTTPSAFSFSATPVATQSSGTTNNVFASKPLSGFSNTFNKFPPQIFASGVKQSLSTSNSEETGEPDSSIATPKPISAQIKNDKSSNNLFDVQTSFPFVTNTPAVPDILKNKNQQENLPKTEKASMKVTEKVVEKLKENIPEKPAENVLKDNLQRNDKKENIVKPLGSQTANKVPVSVSNSSEVTSLNTRTSAPTYEPPKTEVTIEAKTEISETTVTSNTTIKSSASSIPDPANTTTESTSQPLFKTETASSSQKNIQSDSITPNLTEETAVDSSAKPFEASTTTTSPASSIFSAAVASQPKSTQPGSLLSTSPVSTKSSVFGSTQGSIFGTASSTQSSIFGAATSQSIFSSTTNNDSLFSTPSSSSPTPAFGATTSTGSIFGSSPTQAPAAVTTTAATTQSSIFGTANNNSIFGAPASANTSVFGTSTTTTPSAFSPAATQSSTFGSPTTTTSSLFGTATSTTQPSVFGSGSSSVFGSTTSSSAPSIFGGAAAQQSSLFGTAPQSTQASVFGTSSQAKPTSIFGNTPQTTQASIFGTTPTTVTQSASLFGGAESNLFAAASISTTSAPTQASGGNIFGGGSSGSVFGGGSTNVFGGKSAFGQSNATAGSIFGGGSSFAQKPASNLWGTGNTSSGGFGSTGFGQQATTQASSLFGGSAGGSFSSPATSPPFGSPQPASAFGSGDATPSIFGSPTQQTSPAFGGSPVFGAKPAFGQPSSFGTPSGGTGFGSFGGNFNKSPSSGFGAPASFGSGATFGGSAFGNTSPGKVFGGAAPSFASSTQANSTFENLATQNTLTFGNLAQQSGSPAPAAPSFNTSPSFTGWRG